MQTLESYYDNLNKCHSPFGNEYLEYNSSEHVYSKELTILLPGKMLSVVAEKEYWQGIENRLKVAVLVNL